jgi:hypothetical protein
VWSCWHAGGSYFRLVGGEIFETALSFHARFLNQAFFDVSIIQKALELAIVTDEKIEPDQDDPTVDLVRKGEAISLVLTLSMGGIWKPQYVIDLFPVLDLDKVDVLEAKLRDAQEEIAALKGAIP